MVLGFIILQMAIVTRDHGMKAGNKVNGNYIFRNGDRKCREWDGGNLKAAFPPSSDAVLRAVHAARKTAEKSIHIRAVDEQVNKAVMAANRDATAARVAAVKAVQNRIDGKFCETPF